MYWNSYITVHCTVQYESWLAMVYIKHTYEYTRSPFPILFYFRKRFVPAPLHTFCPLSFLFSLSVSRCWSRPIATACSARPHTFPLRSRSRCSRGSVPLCSPHLLFLLIETSTDLFISLFTLFSLALFTYFYFYPSALYTFKFN